MKPRLYLKHAFHDCGWRYEQWACVCYFDAATANGREFVKVAGLGATPEKAYDDWARQVNVDRLETVA